MANHSCISVSQPLTVLDIETVVGEINRRRFKGRFHVPREPELTKMNDARQAWTFQAPGTKPEDPGPFNPDENLGFCFWLNKGGQSIEVRHNPFNAWIREYSMSFPTASATFPGNVHGVVVQATI